MKIKKGDTVKILAGKDKSKAGKVLVVDLKRNRVIVDSINMFKKHRKPKKQGEKGETIDISRPMNISNVSLVCSRCGQSTRVGYKIEDGKKVRSCKKCKNTI
ncbi:50S ribosomal protein L24 [Patescibacteria group bacterium]|nr:50S ribosomal protein L24 [Patescibacteria group bacterium]